MTFSVLGPARKLFPLHQGLYSSFQGPFLSEDYFCVKPVNFVRIQEFGVVHLSITLALANRDINTSISSHI